MKLKVVHTLTIVVENDFFLELYTTTITAIQFLFEICGGDYKERISYWFDQYIVTFQNFFQGIFFLY